jgi:hypothetical protein
MDTLISCDWCGEQINHNKAIQSNLLGTLTMGIIPFLAKDMCSKKCLESYKSNKGKAIKNNKELGQLKFQAKQNDLDLKIKHEKHLFDMQQLKSASKNSKRKENIIEAKEYLNDGGNKFVYYFKIIWANLDSNWKKGLAIFLVWVVIASIIDYFIH